MSSLPLPLAAAEPADAHRQAADAVAAWLGVDPRQGLAAADAAERRRRHGDNRLPEAPPRPWWARLAEPFRDVMVLVLIGAALLSGLLGELADTLAIIAIVLLNAAIGATQQWRAERALRALQRLAEAQAMVRRDGRTTRVDAAALVPGDVVLLEAGNRVPADLRLHTVAQLRIDESALTGESVTVDKQAEALPDDRPALGDRRNMAFKGTLVTHGRAEGLVVATGARTELGLVARLLHGAEPRATPLQRRLAAFGKRLSVAVLAICALILALGLLRGEPLLPTALLAISLAVAAIPEALPAVATVLLALGARRMVRANALVRRLPAVETLGSVSVICSDKTGTLTLNRMRALALHCWHGLTPRRAWRAALLCNDAAFDAPRATWVGDPTETALAEAAVHAGLDAAAERAAAPRLHEWPFDSERKRMTTLHGDRAGALLLVKGAPETTLPRCTRVAGVDGEQPLDAAQVLAEAEALAVRGMRVLALAERRFADVEVARALNADDVERALTLLALVGLADPPRPEAHAAVAQCIEAGIVPIMITGDHPATALAIAREVGIVADADAPVLAGPQLAALDDAALARALAGGLRVFARVDPAQKIRIVRALQSAGRFVAMTGDGVNDAPALRQADIGVAMGAGGTDVAREAAALVLLDDHFATIVAAVREGRRIVDNIRKFIRYALAGNAGEILTLLLASLLAMPVPLLPLHILWINLVTDGLPGLALAAEPAERGAMRRPPRPPDEGLLAGGLWQHTLAVGLLIALLCLGLQQWALHSGAPMQTMVFTALTLAQMAHVLAIRSERESLFAQGLGSNLPLAGAVALTCALQLAVVYWPPLQPLFRTEALAAAELALCLGAAAVVFAAVEAEKAWRRRG